MIDNVQVFIILPMISYCQTLIPFLRQNIVFSNFWKLQNQGYYNKAFANIENDAQKLPSGRAYTLDNCCNL